MSMPNGRFGHEVDPIALTPSSSETLPTTITALSLS